MDNHVIAMIIVLVILIVLLFFVGMPLWLWIVVLVVGLVVLLAMWNRETVWQFLNGGRKNM